MTTDKNIFSKTFPVTPMPQARARITTRNGKPRNVDDKASRLIKNQLKILAAKGEAFYVDKHIPIQVTLIFYLPLIKMSKVRQRKALAGIIRPAKRPDIDNYVKGVFDAFNGIYWFDDGQIVSLCTDKFYAKEPRIELTIRIIEAEI